MTEWPAVCLLNGLLRSESQDSVGVLRNMGRCSGGRCETDGTKAVQTWVGLLCVEIETTQVSIDRCV